MIDPGGWHLAVIAGTGDDAGDCYVFARRKLNPHYEIRQAGVVRIVRVSRKWYRGFPGEKIAVLEVES